MWHCKGRCDNTMVFLSQSLILIPRLSCKSPSGGIGLCNVTFEDAQDGAMEMEPGEPMSF